jgi:colicin import membrane protein
MKKISAEQEIAEKLRKELEEKHAREEKELEERISQEKAKAEEEGRIAAA